MYSHGMSASLCGNRSCKKDHKRLELFDVNLGQGSARSGLFQHAKRARETWPAGGHFWWRAEVILLFDLSDKRFRRWCVVPWGPLCGNRCRRMRCSGASADLCKPTADSGWNGGVPELLDSCNHFPSCFGSGNIAILCHFAVCSPFL